MYKMDGVILQTKSSIINRRLLLLCLLALTMVLGNTCTYQEFDVTGLLLGDWQDEHGKTRIRIVRVMEDGSLEIRLLSRQTAEVKHAVWSIRNDTLEVLFRISLEHAGAVEYRMQLDPASGNLVGKSNPRGKNSSDKLILFKGFHEGTNPP